MERDRKATAGELSFGLTEYQRISSRSGFGRRDPNGIRLEVRDGSLSYRKQGQGFMRIKALAVVLVLALSAALFVQMRRDNRADAAASNCYSDAKGPSAPTLCN
jgi:hypothetical protein